ncbi:hypothetical protein L1887_58903 [Cichorium endivia]|nr:hypothetical protein L1887_58903 [Cichorium endivia]
MGNIGSRHASNVVDGFVLRLARIVDSVLRTINRKLSVLSSYFFSRVFGYDVVFSDELASPTYAAGAGASTATARRGDPLVCGPGNVCIVPASRIQQRLAEKKRRSERRKRAEAAAMGKEMLQRHKAANRRSEYSKVDSPPSSPITEKEKIIHSLGPVARAPPPRPEIERETAAERDRGKLWVLGNVQPTHTVRPQPKVAFYDTPAPASPHRRRRRGEHRRARDPTHARAASSRSHRGDQEGDPAAQVVQAAEPRHGCGHTHRGGGREGRDVRRRGSIWRAHDYAQVNGRWRQAIARSTPRASTRRCAVARTVAVGTFVPPSVCGRRCGADEQGQAAVAAVPPQAFARPPCRDLAAATCDGCVCGVAARLGRRDGRRRGRLGGGDLAAPLNRLDARQPDARAGTQIHRRHLAALVRLGVQPRAHRHRRQDARHQSRQGGKRQKRLEGPGEQGSHAAMPPPEERRPGSQVQFGRPGHGNCHRPRQGTHPRPHPRTRSAHAQIGRTKRIKPSLGLAPTQRKCIRPIHPLTARRIAPPHRFPLSSPGLQRHLPHSCRNNIRVHTRVKSIQSRITRPMFSMLV